MSSNDKPTNYINLGEKLTTDAEIVAHYKKHLPHIVNTLTDEQILMAHKQWRPILVTNTIDEIEGD